MAVSANAQGSLGGVGLAGLALTIIQSKGWIALAAVTLGLPQDVVLALAATLITGAMNYAVTHWAEIRTLNSLIPTTDPTYPTGKNGATDAPAQSSGPDNGNFNKG